MLNAFNGRGRSLRSLDKEKERKLNKRRFTGQTSLQVGFSTPTFVGADSFFLTLSLSLSLALIVLVAIAWSMGIGSF